jgi:hypothetical protein
VGCVLPSHPWADRSWGGAASWIIPCAWTWSHGLWGLGHQVCKAELASGAVRPRTGGKGGVASADGASHAAAMEGHHDVPDRRV